MTEQTLKRDIEAMLGSLDPQVMTSITQALRRIETSMTRKDEVDGCTGACLDALPVTEVRAANFTHTGLTHVRALQLADLPLGVDEPVDLGSGRSIRAFVTSLVVLRFEVLDPSEEFPIASLSLAPEPWTVAYIEVRTDYRRQGLATALYRHAVRRLGPVSHSDHRTTLGQVWAPTVGGFLPPLRGSQS